MLRAGGLDRITAARALESIERAAKHQDRIINDLLDVSRIIKGKLHLEITQINLTQVIEASLEVVRPAAEAKNILINCEYPLEAPLVSADGARLKQVMWNVLSNAVKFTPLGGRIDVQMKPDGSYAQIEVRDTGIGISADFLPHVFERFRQSHTANNQALGGLGLGLALVRYVAEMHGGTVRADSSGLGQGSTFTIKLPLLTAHQYSLGFKNLHLITNERMARSSDRAVKKLSQLRAQRSR